MDSSTPKRINIKSLLVSALCLGGAALSAALFYRDLNEAGGAGLGPPLAKLERRESKVRRKSAASYVWTNTRTEEDLYRKDSIQTAAGSAASIRFEGGGVLDLGENSLVVIDDLENMSLGFVRGSMVVHKADGGDSRVVVGEDGKAQVEQLSVKLLKPEPLAKLFAAEKESKEVQFQWLVSKSARSENSNMNYLLQISTDRGFAPERTQALDIAANAPSDVKLKLGAGGYFWRLRSGSRSVTQAVLTETRQFKILPVSPLRPVSPAPAQTVASFGKDGAVQFRLSIPSAATTEENDLVEHQIQVARDPAFKQIVKTEPVDPSHGGATLKGLPEGSYYWRVQSHYGDVVASSAAAPFKVEQVKKLNLKPLTPDDGSAFGNPPMVRFSWAAEGLSDQTLEYEWVIQSQNDPKISFKAKGPGQAYPWKNPAPGSYQWRIVAHFQGEKVAETPWRKLLISEATPVALESPTRNQNIYYWDKPSEFKFVWRPDATLDPPGTTYRVEVSARPDLQSPIFSKQLRENVLSSQGLKLSSGQLYWRVSALDPAGRILRASDTSPFVYGPFPRLVPPLASSPAPGSSVNPLDKPELAALAWAPVEGATRYDVTVYGDPLRSPSSTAGTAGHVPAPVVLHVLTDKTSVLLRNIAAGKFTWTVRSIDKMKRAGEPFEPLPFTITYGDLLRPPEITSPEVQ